MAMATRTQLERELRDHEATIARLESSSDPVDRWERGAALVSKGRILAQLGRTDEASALLSSTMSSLLREGDEALALACTAGNTRGWVLRQAGRATDAIVAYAEVVEQAAGSSDADVQAASIAAVYGKAMALNQLKRYREGADLLSDLVDRADDPPPGTAETLAKAVLLWAAFEHKLGRLEAASTAYDRLVGRYGDIEEPGVQDTVARGRISQAALVGAAGRPAEAVAICQEAARAVERAERSGTSTDAVVRTELAHWLALAGRTDEARAIYAAVLEQFAPGTNRETDGRLEMARREHVKLSS
jgi:tetratricopeptide (TPR) repeat protein